MIISAQADAISDVDKDQVYTLLEQQHHVCVRGLVAQAEVDNVKQNLIAQFNPNNDHPSTGESPNQVKNNFQKLSCGGVLPHGESCGRLVRTFYTPLWAEDRYQVHDLFRSVIALRNHLIDKPADYLTDKVEDGLWSACRIHQYPSGGGFMASHHDSYIPKINADKRLAYLQFILVMADKPDEFSQGGGFVDCQGKRLVLEDHYQVGDVIIYNNQSYHGVMDIDPHKLLDLTKINGRLCGIVTIYRDMLDE